MMNNERKNEAIVLGVVNGKKFWHNECLTAMPSNKELYAMSTETLERAAYADLENHMGVRMEPYRAHSDFKTAQSYGRRSNEEYSGICRAMIHLLFRRELIIENKISLNQI